MRLPGWALCAALVAASGAGSADFPPPRPEADVRAATAEALRREIAELQHRLDLVLEASSPDTSLVSSPQQQARRLGEDGGGDSEAGGHEEHPSHPHDALVYLIMTLIIGTMILHLTTLPIFHALPYTVVLFVLGGLSSLMFHALGSDSTGLLGRSYEMWMEIDPHLLIFTMLPVLLTGDAMTIDTAVAKRVSSQCLWLAGPGVLVSALATGVFLHLYMQWEFLLCVAVGAILAATDPVAVVGLLKELGASPTLTVQIQGESLLNDGTAMVLFLVAYNMLKGEHYDAKGILLFLFYMVAGSWFLGAVVGAVFSSWIRSAGNRLQHHSSMIQISLTLCCAYGSFTFAEGVIGISGVLSNVAAGLVLADTIWPKIVSQEAMHEVWHTIEYLGNTVIFFLAGALSSKAMLSIDPIDYLHLLLIYVVVMVIRGAVLFASRPILRLLSPDRTPVTVAEAAVMTWGGLRGAVGLALAIQVSVDRAGGVLEQEVANRVLFFTGGIAMLTLILNATTCPMLVRRLGITATPHTKARLMLQIHQRLVELGDQNKGRGKKIVTKLLKDIEHHIHAECPLSEQSHMASQQEEASVDLPRGSIVVAEYHDAKAGFDEISTKHRELLGWDVDNPLIQQEADLLTHAAVTVDPEMFRTVNEAFLGMVRSEYWGQIGRGEFVSGTTSAEAVLSANAKALQLATCGITDLNWVLRGFGLSESDAANMATGPSLRSSLKKCNTFNSETEKSNCLDFCTKAIRSLTFRGIIVAVIVINSVVIFLDPGPQSLDAVMWVILDCAFQAFYIVELVMKFIVFRWKFFSDGWNVLDFMCVVLGLFGNMTSVIVAAGLVSSTAVSNEMLLIRLGRVFKLMRLLRLVALIKFCRTLHAKYKGKKVSRRLASRLELIGTLRAFVQAHVRSHSTLLKFFGKESEEFRNHMSSLEDLFDRQISSNSFARQISLAGTTGLLAKPEEARCIVESFTEVFKAMKIGSSLIGLVDEEGSWILESMCTLRDTCLIAADLTEFVVSAMKVGVLKEKDAEVLIHPLHQHLHRADILLSDAHAGIHRNTLKKYGTYDCNTLVEEDHQDNYQESSKGEGCHDINEAVLSERDPLEEDVRTSHNLGA